MVAPVNEFDKILQAEYPRTLAARGGIILSTTANTVLVDGAGAGSPAIVTLKASPLVVAGSVAWSTSPTVPLSIDTTGLIATLNFSDMGTSSVVVTTTLTSNGLTYTDSRTINQVRIGSLGYTGALNATANSTTQGLLSARPAGANGDFYFATDTLTLYQKISGSWVAAGNNFTNTNQLTDGAGLGTTSTWAGVSGSGKPADNASTDITLVGTNVTIVGNSATKTGGAQTTWDAQVYSKDSFVGGAFAVAAATDTTTNLMFGLNSDPTTDASYVSIDFAIYLNAGTARVSEFVNGVGNSSVSTLGTYVAGDVFAVIYDGSSVKYVKNGVVGYTSVSANSKLPNQTFFFDSSLYHSNAKLSGIRVGPMTSNNWTNVGGDGKPADNASADVVLVGRGAAVTGNSAVKTATGGWGNADVYSLDSYTGGAFASAVVGETTTALMFGLNSDPSTDSTYTGLDYAVYLAGGSLVVYESGVNRGTFGTYAAGDILVVVYDGSSVKYLKNGVVFYTSASANASVPNQTLFFDSAFNTIGGTLKNIRFGPLTSNNWANIGGTNKPEDNATVGANAGNLAVTLGGDNLMSNSGFEIRTTATQYQPNGWQAYNSLGVSVSYLDIAGRIGGKAAALKANASTTGTFGFFTSSAMVDGSTTGGVYGGWQPNKTYVVSFKAKKVNGAAWTTCALRWNTQPTLTTAIFNPVLTTSWQTYAFRITTGATPEALARLYIDRIGNTAAGDEFHLDEVLVQETDVFSEWFLSSREAAAMSTSIVMGADGTLTGAAGAQGQVTLPGMGLSTFRVITRGSSETATLPAPAGFYVNGALSGAVSLARSYTAVVIDRTTLNIDSAKRYDVYGVGAQTYDGVARTAATLAADLNALPNTKIVVVISSDEPKTNRLTSGLDAAMYRCGASRAVFGSANFKSRSAYVLIGIPGVGEGGGAEAYQGSIDNDTNAWVDMAFNIVNGALSGVSSGFTPKTLSDYGYIGDLNATAGATLGTNVNGQITSSNSGTLVGTGAIGSTQISDLRTSNYAEDASANPTAGAKLSSTGTALKVANNSFQVGTLVFSDYWFRLVQGIDGSVTSNRIIWRGNNDATTRGGAPDINRLIVTPNPTFISDRVQYSSGDESGVHTISHSFKLFPSTYSNSSDNLDAMQQIHVQLFAKAYDLSPFAEFYQACPSRTYDGATGSVQGTWVYSFPYYGKKPDQQPALTATSSYPAYNPQLSGISPNVVWGNSYQEFINGQQRTGSAYTGLLRVRIANTYGWSATRDFGPSPATDSNGTVLGFNNLSQCLNTPITGVAGSSGGGSGSSGGACPAPWVKVRLLSGKDVNAEDLHNGARLAAVNDSTMEAVPQGGVVQDLAIIWARRYRVKLVDGAVSEWSENHRFAVVGRGWVRVQDLRGGDHVAGLRECIVESVLCAGEGRVVSFRVEGAGTYFAGDLLCHNAKASF